MINLVPAIVRKNIVKEYWVRVISVFLFLSVLLSLLFLAISLPVYVLISSQVSAYGVSATEAAARVAEFDVSTGALIKGNLHAQKIVEGGRATDFSVVVAKLEAKVGEGVTLRSYELSRKDGLIAPVSVKGNADTRQALADFHAALRADPSIEKVDLPISNLAKEKDIEFSLTVTFKKTN